MAQEKIKAIKIFNHLQANENSLRKIKIENKEKDGYNINSGVIRDILK